MNNNLVEIVLLAKTDKEYMKLVMDRLRPLINSYVKKLFFLDPDDAEQEIVLAIMEAVHSIKRCENNGQCLTYIINAVYYSYVKHCKKNMIVEQYEFLDNEKTTEKCINDKYDDVDFWSDINNKLSKLPSRHRTIIRYLLLGYTDREIAETMHMSRQYINRLKKQIGVKLLTGDLKQPK